MSAENQAVRAVIEAYVSACEKADTEALKSLFHADALMSGFLAGQRMVGPVEPFFQAVAANPAPGGDYQSQIENIQVSGGIGTATLREQGYMGMNFVNHFQLLDVDGEWLLVAKLFESS